MRLGWQELLVIAVVGIVVVGPKDLPLVIQIIRAFVGKLRSFAGDFRNLVDDFLAEEGIDATRRELKDVEREVARVAGDIERSGIIADDEDSAIREKRRSASSSRRAIGKASAGKSRGSTGRRPERPRRSKRKNEGG